MAMVGVAFQQVGKVYYYALGPVEYRAGDAVVAETARGLELGRVVGVQEVPPESGGEMSTSIHRHASQEDLGTAFRNRLRAAEALRIARERVAHHDLPMKLLGSEYTLDGNRIVFYFSAEGRVDFRELVRDLAASLRRRIELHQVGARDRAKSNGGLGPCGRECCCSSWLREFSPVSIKMTKEQGLSLNPTKISGSCGRLMCCLRYEYETYRQLRREMPPIGSILRLPEGNVRVVAQHLARYTLTVSHEQLGTFEVPAGRSLVGEAAELCPSCHTRPCQSEETSPSVEVSAEGEVEQPRAPRTYPSQEDSITDSGRRKRPRRR